MNNTDFRSLLNNGGGGLSKKENEKSKFSLSEISKLERENQKKKPKHDAPEKAREKKKAVDSQYRDRAAERRDDNGSNEGGDLEKLASNMDIEQSKFLGGDESHTHLVKGLDFALLNKMRSKTSDGPPGKAVAVSTKQAKQAKQESGPPPPGVPVKPRDTKTDDGIELRIGQLMGVNSSSMQNSKSELWVQRLQEMIISDGKIGNKFTTKAGLNLSNIAFEFDTNSESSAELPTIINKSNAGKVDRSKTKKKNEINYSNPYISANILTFDIMKNLIEALSMSTGSKKKRKKDSKDQNKALPEKEKAVEVATEKKVSIFDDDDIFADAGAYVPSGALSESEKNDAISTTAKGLFDDIPTKESKEEVSECNIMASQLLNKLAAKKKGGIVQQDNTDYGMDTFGVEDDDEEDDEEIMRKKKKTNK